MPAPQERDLNKATSSFKSWLIHEKGLDKNLDVEILGGPENTGFSNETLSFIVTEKNKKTGYVLRFHPTGYFVFPEYDIEKQFLIMKHLRPLGIKVPEVVWYEPNPDFLESAFYVMKMCDGQAPSDNPPFHQEGWLFDSNEELRQKVWNGWIEEMSKIHKVEVSDDFNFLINAPASVRPLDQDLSFYQSFYEWAIESEKHEVLEQTMKWLRENKPKQSSDQFSIQWGDCRVPNIMYNKKGSVTGVLDWEMVSLGDPCQDLAWGIAIDDCNTEGINVEKLSGFPSKQQTIELWEELTGLKSTNFNYYYLLSIYKFAVIMIRVVKKLEYYEIMPPGLDAHINNHASQMLQTKLGEM